MNRFRVGATLVVILILVISRLIGFGHIVAIKTFTMVSRGGERLLALLSLSRLFKGKCELKTLHLSSFSEDSELL